MSISITMPRLSDTMEVGTIIKWNVKEGDSVSSGDVLADIETDKATMEMQAYDDGKVAKILVSEGQTVEVGKTIAVLAEEGEDPSTVAATSGKADGKSPRAKAKAEKPASKAKPAEERKPASTSKPEDDEAADDEAADAAPQEAPAAREEPEQRHDDDAQHDGRVRVSPVARRLADENDIDVSTLHGSGPSGRVIKRDVLAAIEAGQETAAAVPPSAREEKKTKPQTDAGVADSPRRERGEMEQASASSLSVRVHPRSSAVPSSSLALRDEKIPLSNARQTIARRLVESKTTIPHYQVTRRFDVAQLLDLRATLNQQLAAMTGGDVKLSVNDFLVRACALAMHQHPLFNASWGGDHIQIHGQVNIGVAISLPIERGGGLVVATIRDADRLALRDISEQTRQLAEKARTRGLTLEEMSDSTFTISNLGMYGVDEFTAIINPPNTAILAVGAAVEQPVVRDGQIVIGHEMAATLSCDHRVIDGAMAAEFQQTLKQLIEQPATLLV